MGEEREERENGCHNHNLADNPYDIAYVGYLMSLGVCAHNHTADGAEGHTAENEDKRYDERYCFV